MCNAKWTFPLFFISLFFSCGVLFPGPSLPSLEEIQEAKNSQKAEWEKLEAAYVQLMDNFEVGEEFCLALIAKYPNQSRLQFLLQDMRLRYKPDEDWLSYYLALELEQPTAMNASLIARLHQNREKRINWVEKALGRNPNFLAAKVLELGCRADAGDPLVLNDIVELLEEHPGCAEAWRLLRQIAPVFARFDYAKIAAETEPWSNLDEKFDSTYAKSVTALQSGDASSALRIANNLSDSANVLLLRAAALAQGARPVEALEIIDGLLEKEPQNPIALFNRALLLRDYLGRGLEAEKDLVLFLELTEGQQTDFFLRRSQAEFWLGKKKN